MSTIEDVYATPVSLTTAPTDGITLRDYFAAMAMTGFVSSYPTGSIEGPLIRVALDAFDMADAMLEARKSRSSHD